MEEQRKGFRSERESRKEGKDVRRVKRMEEGLQVAVGGEEEKKGVRNEREGRKERIIGEESERK